MDYVTFKITEKVQKKTSLSIIVGEIYLTAGRLSFVDN